MDFHIAQEVCMRLIPHLFFFFISLLLCTCTLFTKQVAISLQADPGLFIGQVNSDGALQSPVPEAFDPAIYSKSNTSEVAGRY
jgi:hypothetical protein